jgi:hypothetical protein
MDNQYDLRKRCKMKPLVRIFIPVKPAMTKTAKPEM